MNRDKDTGSASWQDELDRTWAGFYFNSLMGFYTTGDDLTFCYYFIFFILLSGPVLRWVPEYFGVFWRRSDPPLVTETHLWRVNHYYALAGYHKSAVTALEFGLGIDVFCNLLHISLLYSNCLIKVNNGCGIFYLKPMNNESAGIPE